MRYNYEIPDIEKREFGFLFPSHIVGRGKDEKQGKDKKQKPIMSRHLSFPSDDAVWRYIEKRKPLDCFYSTAYYEHPSALKMDEKGWLGADLFYDLDGAVEYMSKIRAEAATIEYALKLKGENGFALESIEVFFSGAKGYHVVASDVDIRKMEGDARVDMVDYLVGKYKCEFIDVPASTDTHRLRRMPGTKNSKSGKFCEKIVKKED